MKTYEVKIRVVCEYYDTVTAESALDAGLEVSNKEYPDLGEYVVSDDVVSIEEVS